MCSLLAWCLPQTTRTFCKMKCCGMGGMFSEAGPEGRVPVQVTLSVLLAWTSQVHLICGAVSKPITNNQAEYMAVLHGMQVGGGTEWGCQGRFRWVWGVKH